MSSLRSFSMRRVLAFALLMFTLLSAVPIEVAEAEGRSRARGKDNHSVPEINAVGIAGASVLLLGIGLIAVDRIRRRRRVAADS